MSISPPSVYLQYSGQGQMTQTTFLCAGISSADVSTTFDKVISLKITRSTRRGTTGQTPTTIAFIEPGEGARIPQVQDTTDIQNRAAVSGTVDSVDYTQSNLQLVIDSNAIECDDVGQYTCLFTYRDTALDQHEVPSSMNLSVNGMYLIINTQQKSVTSLQIFSQVSIMECRNKNWLFIINCTSSVTRQ